MLVLPMEIILLEVVEAVEDGPIQTIEETRAMVQMFTDTMMMQRVGLEVINGIAALGVVADFGLAWELEDSWDICWETEEGM